MDKGRKSAVNTCLILPTDLRSLRHYSRRVNASTLPRRRFLRFAAGAAALAAISPDANAQTYPSRPITMIVPGAAGGPADVLARLMAERMRGSLGQSIIIENVTGADGSIAVGQAARAKPDGNTIGIGNMSTHVLNGAFYPLQYDVLNAFAPIAPLVTTPLLLFARKTVPAKDLPELIAWLKANPNSASVGIPTSVYRLLTRFFQKETGTQFTLVPYRGAAPARQDLVAGQIDLLFDQPDALALVRAGSIKAYAVTSDARVALAPGIPTFAENGLPTLSWSGWYGFFAPRGTPKDAIDKLNAATVATLADPTVRSRLDGLGLGLFSPEQQTPDALGALVKAAAEKWWPVIKEFGIKAE
jgi:tripartite-type tricarboxylate transporter receptor subunit TctC